MTTAYERRVVVLTCCFKVNVVSYFLTLLLNEFIKERSGVVSNGL